MPNSDTGPTTDDSFELSRRGIMKVVAGSGLALGAASGAAFASDGPVQVVIRAEEVDPDVLPLDADRIDELKATASESQAPIIDWAEQADGVKILNQFWLANAVLVEVDTEITDIDQLKAVDGVDRIHTNFILEIPEDAPESPGITAEELDTTYGLEQINAPDAWDTFDTRGEGVTVAVLDTGVDEGHPDLAVDEWAEFDSEGALVESDPNDGHGHGTHVSGTVVGPEEPADEDVAAYGVAPDASLWGVKVLDDGGGGTFAQILAGMEWAAQEGADVMNMSLGALGYHGEMIEPVVNGYDLGTLTVSSSGNDGPGTSGSPANVYDAFAIGASNEDEEIAGFSSGETVDTESAWSFLARDHWPDEYIVPDVSAPGVDVISAFLDGEYATASGTSMASPHVAGLVCLLEAAAVDEFGLTQLTAAMTSTAWKPEGEPEEQDTRYGHGIVDALQATSRVAANSGVQGAVSDADGGSLEGATVDLDGFPVETDADGEYTLRALAGTYDVTADAFGFVSQTESVVVEEETFTSQDFSLTRQLEIEVVSDQPLGLEAGESFDVELAVAHADGITVELGGDFANGAELAIDGDDEARFGERYAFDEAFVGAVTVTVLTDERGRGDLELDHTVDGLGDEITVTTGPTTVFEEPVPVGVVDIGEFGADIVALLGDEMPPWFTFEVLTPADALAAAEDREHEAYIAQDLGTDEELIADFAEETSVPEIGVVYLDQFGEDSNAVSQLSAATGDPTQTFDAFVQGFAPPIDYSARLSHSILEGIVDADESVVITQPPGFIDPFFGIVGGFHTYYEDFQGEIAGWTFADTQVGIQDTGEGLGIDDLSRTILASSLGLGFFVGRQDITADGRAILANAVEHASFTPEIRVIEIPAERIAPTETATLVIDTEDLIEVEIDVTGLQFLDEDDLTLVVDGEEADLGEPVTFDAFDGELTIEIETADVIGEFAMDTQFKTLGDRDQEVTTEATFRPTTVYESPIRVPDQLDDLQQAVDFVVPGDEVVIAEGLYEVDEPDRGFQTGLYIETPDITVRGEEDGTVEIIHDRDLPSPRIINIDADGVTLTGVDANIVDGEVDDKNSIGSGIIVNEFTDGVTVEDVTTAGTFGIQFEGNISNVSVNDVTAIETVIGVGTDSGAFGDVTDATITNVTVTDRPDFTFRGGIIVDSGASRVTVTDCEIEMEDGENGIWLEGPFGGGEDSLVADNTIIGDDIVEEPGFGVSNAGIYVDEVACTVEDNAIEDVYYGIQISDFGFGDEPIEIRHNDIQANGSGFYQLGDRVTFEHNVVDAPIGIQLGEDPDESFPTQIDADAILAQYNDLSAAEVPFVGEPDEPFFDPPEFLIFDCRQNFLGDRGYDETIADGSVEYEPFLTEPPDEIDFSQPIEIGVDLYLDAGETYGTGIPGPTDQTIWDILGVEAGGGHNEFDGEVYSWSDARENWRRVTGVGSLADQDSLVGFKVEPAEGVRAVVHFQFMEDAVNAPPGRRDFDLGETEVHEGMNIVCAPAYGDDDLFGVGTATVESIEAKELGAPKHQLSEWKAEDEPKRPFSAYYVEVSEAGTIECDLDEYDPTKDDIYEAFGLEPDIHDEPGASVISSTIDELTVGDVLDTVSDEEAEAALVKFSGHRFVVGMSDEGTTEQRLGVMEDIGDTLIDEAPAGDEDLVADAVFEAMVTILQREFGAQVIVDPDSPADERLPLAIQAVADEQGKDSFDSTDTAVADD